MDYEVFLVARIKELHDAGASSAAVEQGVLSSGRVITSAAVRMVIVFAGLAAGTTLAVKQLGLALMLAVLVDATPVRCLLVPATMVLLGEWNWWAPRRLRHPQTMPAGTTAHPSGPAGKPPAPRIVGRPEASRPQWRGAVPTARRPGDSTRIRSALGRQPRANRR